MTEDKRSIIQMVAGLIEQGKKNQDKIAYSKILDTFSGVEISSEQFDNILKVLEDNKIEVLRSKNDMEQTVSLSAKEKEPDEVDDEELEESKILLDIDDDIEEDSEENIEEDLSVMEGADIDCAILPDPLGDYAVMNGARCMIDDSQLENNYSVTVIIVTKELIDEQREITEKFVSAYDEAVDMLNDSPDNYKELIFDVANVPEDMRDIYVVTEYPKNSVPGSEEVEGVVEWMKNKGLIDNEYTYEEVVDASFCEE